MREGLLEVKNTNFPKIGTITIDSFTRTLQFEDALKAIKKGKPLNGYPIVSYNCEENKKLIDGIKSKDFPIQVRHGCPKPEKIFEATIKAGIDAIEGGPISYSLPYGRISLKESIQSWANCSKMYAEAGNGNFHIESFGGCMLGQLCPPSMLIVISILEALFFNSYGVNSVSVSFTQGTNSQQDIAALKALKKLCNKYLEKHVDWHIVFYTFMGKFPETIHGAKAILKESSIIATLGEAKRLIVKTINEAHQIPTIDENISALKLANEVANNPLINSERITGNEVSENQIYNEANLLLETILNFIKQFRYCYTKSF
jgi:methylaspartate mutase epsilon subunit